MVSKQWFVTMEPLAEKALHAVETRELTIIPERFEKVPLIMFVEESESQLDPPPQEGKKGLHGPFMLADK